MCHESSMWADWRDDNASKIPCGGIEGPDYIPDPECNGFRLHDAEFITNARTDLPKLVADNRRLINELVALRRRIEREQS